MWGRQSRRHNRNGGDAPGAMAKSTLGGDPPLVMIHIKHRRMADP
jgi:hypothetical protein